MREENDRRSLTLTIDSLSIEDGSIHFIDLGAQGTPIQIDNVQFELANFSATRQFDIDSSGSVLGENSNAHLSGKVGRCSEKACSILTHSRSI